MNDAASQPAETPTPLRAPDKGERNLLPWIVAALGVVMAVVLAFLIGAHPTPPSVGAGTPSYAANIVLSNVQMSQASNFAGSQLTYIDGVISNHGNRTVTHLTVEALFANDAAEPPQAEQVPFTLIRTRDPYVDTIPVSASPIAPGTSRDFRLIYEDVSPMWNQQLPQLKIISVTTRP